MMKTPKEVAHEILGFWEIDYSDDRTVEEVIVEAIEADRRHILEHALLYEKGISDEKA